MIYLVTGLRSGTSMMMAAFEAGGMDVVKSSARDRLVHVAVDRMADDYKANPTSFYEPQYRNEARQPDWPRKYDGKVLKVIIPFLNEVAVHDYRVLFMRRDAEEMRQSYFAAHGGDVRNMEQTVAEALRTLSNRKDVELQELWYPDVLNDPRGSFESLGWPLDVTRAASVIDPTRYRFKRELLHAGA